MKNLKLLNGLVLFVFLLTIHCSTVFGQGTMYAITNTNVLYTIDLTTGNATSVGALGIGGTSMIVADDNTGSLYVSTFNGKFYSVDIGTGAATFVGDIDIAVPSFQNLTWVEGITFNPADGKIYASANVGAVNLSTPMIITIDPTNAQATLLGNTGGDNDRITINNGNAYSIDYPSYHSLNLTTFTNTAIGSPPGLGSAWADDPADPGFVYSNSGNNLVKVNPATGTVINIVGPFNFPSGTGLHEFTFIPQTSPVVPTLGEWGLIVLSLSFLSIGAVIIRKRKSVAKLA